MKYFPIVFSIILSFLNATGAWMMSQRSHGELKWNTISTDHFDIHYHDGIKEIAVKGASIAEQIRPVLMKQMGLDTLRRLDIAFTTEDEILNGFATPGNYTLIWVDQNDAGLWTGDEKWLRTVLAHELQHLVFFNTVKGPWWLPEPMNSLVAGVPGWVVEGLAEYYTEKWRPFRYDISHKGHVVRNTVHKIQDPHNDGFSKSLYLADRFGDSTITKILSHRNKAGFLYFESSFKKHTGIKLKQFNEDWRRHMNTFYYGQRAQKERLEDVGKVHALPMKRVVAFDVFNDTMRIAMIGLMSKGQRDLSLVVATRDTAKERKIWKKRVEKAGKKGEKPKRVRPKWKLKELDHGIFGELIINLDVSPDNTSIVYPKYRYGGKQSLMYGIWKLDVATKKKTLLISSMRANHPKFSPDGKKIAFVAHENSISQIYTMNADGSNIKQITYNEGDTQIITPAWSPDGKSIAYAQSDPDGLMDIHVLELSTKQSKQITNSSEGDFLPIWYPDGKKISYTGLYDYTPNLYTHDLASGATIQNTDVGDAVIGAQWNEQTSTITAFTLNTVDSARVVEIDPARRTNKTKLNINSAFSSWRTKTPDYPLVSIDPNKEIKIRGDAKYKFYKNMRHLGTILLPDVQSLLYNGAFTDGLGRHTVAGFYATDYDTIHSVAFQYQNSTGFPFGGFWGVDIYKDFNFQLQFYNREQNTLVELFNGISLWGRYPYNFGYSLSANHIMEYSFQFMDRVALFDTIQFSSDVFEYPESGKEGSVNFRYAFLSKRNHARNMFSPNQGYGLEILIKKSSPSLWGDFDYLKTEMDFYTNKKVGPFSLYGRGRYERMSGDPPDQEKLGIINIPNYYISGTLTPGREYMTPRGYSGKQMGDQAFMGTIELRAPVIPLDIIEVLKVIKFGKPTFALISDFGNAWNEGSKMGDLIITTGAEFRLSLTLANAPLFIFSYGWAQTPEKWNKDWEKLYNTDSGDTIETGPKPYFQMTLINPF